MASRRSQRHSHRAHRFAVWVFACIALTGLAPDAVVRAQQCDAGALRIGGEGGLDFPGDEFSGKGMSRPARGFGSIGLEFFPFDNIGTQLIWFGGHVSNVETGLAVRKFAHVELPPGVEPFDYAEYGMNYFGVQLGLVYRIPIAEGMGPLLFGRAGMFRRSTIATLGTTTGQTDGTVFMFGGGIGVEIEISPSLSLRTAFQSYLTNSDQLDGFVYGSNNDGLAMLTLGVYWSMNAFRQAQPHGVPRPATSPEGLLAQRRRSDSVPSMQGSGESSEVAAHGASARGDASSDADGVRTLALSTTVTMRDLASLRDLQWTPDALTLNVRRSEAEPLRLSTRLDITRSGEHVASAAGSVLLMGTSASFDARGLVDMQAMDVAAACRDSLPEGAYLVTVTLAHQAAETPVTAVTSFEHTNFERIFGAAAERARYVVSSGNAFTERSAEGVLCLDTFVDNADPLAPTLQRHLRVSGIATSRARTVDDAIDDAPITLLPPTVIVADRRDYLNALVRNSFTKADALLRMLPEGSSDAVRIIGARMYFAHGDSSLSDESRILLEQVAVHISRFRGVRCDVYGCADERGDDAAALRTAQSRANVVEAYLVRRGVPAHTLRVVPVTRASIEHGSTLSQRQEHRRVDLVLTPAGDVKE